MGSVAGERWARTLLAALVLGAAAAPARAGDAIQARRTRQAPRIDGQLDEASWAGAVPFSGFVDTFPDEGAAPSERTEIRVLYDEENLYFAFLCHDSRPGEVVRKLGNRDAPPLSDTVEVAIDFARDRRTGYLFGVNAAGVQYDRLLYADDQTTAEWDAVWGSAVATRPDGWSAELAIPLRLFRFSQGASEWGILARRRLARTHEEISSVLVPRRSKGYVSLFGRLDGLHDLKPRRNLELLPYLASRLVLHPAVADGRVSRPRTADPSLDLGLDLRAVVSQLQLNVTVNPDFGQVEADEIVLNLTNQEVVFPEKRPFFFQGTEIFQPVPGGAGMDGEQVLFYPRRIGLATPILGAGKLVGQLAPGLNLGLLDAVVAGAATTDPLAPDRRLRFDPLRPLHLGLRDEVVSPAAIVENYFAGALSYNLGAASAVGLRAASAVPLDRCETSSCAVIGSNVGAVDWRLRTADADWVVQGQAEVSQVVGGRAGTVLDDGTVQNPGQTGWGTYLQAGKLGGEPIRFDLDYAHISPTLELNGAGFLPSQNRQDLVAQVHFVRPTGFGGLHAFDTQLSGRQAWTTDGRLVNRQRNITYAASATLPGFHVVGIDTGYEFSWFDTREIAGTGIPFQRIPVFYFLASAESDPSRTVSASVSYAREWWNPTAADGARPGHNLQLGLHLRPQSRFESSLGFALQRQALGPRYAGQVLDARALFGDLESAYLSATLRQQLVLRPGLVCQGYAQLFTARGRYLSFLEATMTGRQPIRLSDLRPTAAATDGFYQAGLRINLVVRWEYRPGSVLFAVYNRSGENLPAPDQPAPVTLAPVGLHHGRTTDTFLVKWSYFWHL
jgi:hypothetical protein